MRDFDKWLDEFKDTIVSFDYFSDFKKIVANVDKIKIELNILNSLIGSKNIEDDFERVVKEYPQTLKCIPILLAVRESQLKTMNNKGEIVVYDFRNPCCSIEEYKTFMKETGLFDMLSNHIISSLVDYVTGVETGLDSNARKNRGGHKMEDLVESYIEEAGFEKDKDYFKEMYLKDIENKWCVDLSALSNQGKTQKRFDFVVKTDDNIYAIETNFYSANGSKLNETARSYKELAEEAEDIKGFKFVWFTDGKGWNGAKNNLKETFEVLENLYSIEDLKDGIIKKIFK